MSIVEYERPVLLTVEQAAEYLTVSERFIRRIRYEGRLPGVKLGRHLRFRKDDLDRFIEQGGKDTHEKVNLWRVVSEPPRPNGEGQ